MSSELTPEYLHTLRSLSGEDKLRSAFKLYWSARKLKASFLRGEHPDWKEDTVQAEVKRIFSRATT
ncbi:MAG: hypothetical protein AB8F34_03820 [Akkermansiaceae bacterium]